MLSLLVMLGGCQLVDENPKWNPPQDYPSWTYDAPFYYRPSEDLPVAETVGAGIPVYYASGRLFFVKHPAGYQVPREPRIAVWCSLDEGDHWERAGYFGVEQTHFLFQAEADGRHWLRFTGPGQSPPKGAPAAPQRVYVVDTTPPSIQLTIEPAPVERDEEGNVVGPHIYSVEEPVKLRWSVRDRNLVAESVLLSTTFEPRPELITWSRFPEELKPTGQLTVPVPGEAARAGGGVMRFRIEARDRGGNVSFGLSEVLHVDGPGKPPQPPKPAPPSPLIAQAEGSPGPRPGWPESGVLVRGGTSRILSWLPKDLQKHGRVVLQFSPNNGRSWRTVAENLQLGKSVKWTVPEVNSKVCRLRVLSVPGPGRKIMLAKSVQFIVHTAPPTIHVGPRELPPEPE